MIDTYIPFTVVEMTQTSTMVQQTFPRIETIFDLLQFLFEVRLYNYVIPILPPAEVG